MKMEQGRLSSSVRAAEPDPAGCGGIFVGAGLAQNESVIRGRPPSSIPKDGGVPCRSRVPSLLWARIT